MFEKFVQENNLITSNPSIFCINSRYSGKLINPRKKKENLIVYAARFVHVKRPLFFIEAINILKTQKFNFRNWKFKMYGKGDLDKKVSEAIVNYDLQELIKAIQIQKWCQFLKNPNVSSLRKTLKTFHLYL